MPHECCAGARMNKVNSRYILRTLPWGKPGQQGTKISGKFLMREYSPHWACFLLTVFEAFGRLCRRCDRGTDVPTKGPFFKKGGQGIPSLEFQKQLMVSLTKQFRRGGLYGKGHDKVADC
jgi:hypothetical protein